MCPHETLMWQPLANQWQGINNPDHAEASRMSHYLWPSLEGGFLSFPRLYRQPQKRYFSLHSTYPLSSKVDTPLGKVIFVLKTDIQETKLFNKIFMNNSPLP